MKNKWILWIAAIAIMACNLFNTDFSAFRALSPSDFWPVFAIAVLSFLIKTGVLSALFVGVRKLLNRLRGRK
jgi:hypothetical protein